LINKYICFTEEIFQEHIYFRLLVYFYSISA